MQQASCFSIVSGKPVEQFDEIHSSFLSLMISIVDQLTTLLFLTLSLHDILFNNRNSFTSIFLTFLHQWASEVSIPKYITDGVFFRASPTHKIFILAGKVCVPASVESFSWCIAVCQNLPHIAKIKLFFNAINYNGTFETSDGLKLLTLSN